MEGPLSYLPPSTYSKRPREKELKTLGLEPCKNIIKLILSDINKIMKVVMKLISLT